MLHIHKTHTTLVFHAMKYFHMPKLFLCKPKPLYSTQNSDLFATYTEGFNMHTGQPNPQFIINEYICGKLVLNPSNNKYTFPALNVCNNFDTIDYDTHINTTTYYSIIHVFRSMSLQELNILHTVCESEQNQLLTRLGMSVQNPQLAGFLLTGKCSNFLYAQGSTACSMTAHIFSLLYTKPIIVSIAYLYTSKLLSCMLTQLQDKHIDMQLLSPVTITLETLLNYILTRMIKICIFWAQNL